MSSPEKKRKVQEKRSLLELPQFLSLPDELVLSCLARVSKSYYPTLSLVCKTFQSLLASPELYQTRSHLNCTEIFLYVCLKFPPDTNLRLFTFCLKPNRTLINNTRRKKKKKLDGLYVSAKLPIRDSHPNGLSSFVAVGSDIYNIGGWTIEHQSASSVSILDCCSHTWKVAPNMCMKRHCPEASVVDGKIYVAGGSQYCTSSNWMEVFDLKTESWEFVSCSYVGLGGAHVEKTAWVDGKLHTFRYGSDWVYDTKKFTWAKEKWDIHINAYDYTMIENVLYYYSSGVVYWIDVKKHIKGTLRGLEGLPKISRFGCVKLSDYGGKMAILWDRYVRSSGSYKVKMIWCAVIALERRSSEEIWGTVKWSDGVFTVPKSYEFVHALSVIV